MFSCTRNSYVFTGTYTKNDKSGIHIYKFNEKSGSLLPASKTENINDPSYLAFSKNKKYLYSVNEGDGRVSSFYFDQKQGSLLPINQQSSEGGAPCYIAVDKSGKFLSVANYTGGNFVIYPLSENGEILPSVQNIRFTASDNKPSHAHQTIFSPDNKYLFVTDLGGDKLYQYSFNANAQTPVANNPKVYKISAEHGPRHLAIDAAGRHLYLLNEWEGNIFTYKIMEDSLRFVQENISTGIVNPQNKNKGSAAIKISPDGKFLYASNRGITNSIAIFKIDKNGMLSKVGEQKTDEHPRDFMISRSGKFLLIASRDGNSIKTYLRNSQTGLLNYSGVSTSVSMPVMLLEY